MKMVTKKLALMMMALCVTSSVWAQENIETPAQKTKEAVERLKAAPSRLGRVVQHLGHSGGANMGMSQGTGDLPKTQPESPAVLQADKEIEERKPAGSTLATKRDPFRPFTLNTKPTPRPRENLSPLERYDLGQLKLVGVIWDVRQPNAIVEDAAGLGYVVKIGTPIGSNDGKVKSIQPAGLVIEEFQFDVYGAKKKVERSMRLEPEKAE
jgi:Tfp pilus assembly protein PilP